MKQKNKKCFSFFAGYDWLKGFKKRRPKVADRAASKVNKNQATFTMKEHQIWLEKLAHFVTNRDENPGCQHLLEDPRRIWNADETGFAFNAGKIKKKKTFFFS